jgi:protein import protein ZIM17
MRERGQLVKKGTLSEDGDLEFWEDGSVSEAQGAKEAKEVIKDEEAEK